MIELIIRSYPRQIYAKHSLVGYSQKDEKYLKELKTLTDLIIPDATLSVWSDTRIESDSNGKSGMKDSLSSADAAIFLWSQNFGSSSYAASDNILPFAQGANRKDCPIFVVKISEYTSDQATGFSSFGFVNEHSLDELDLDHRNAIWFKVISAIKGLENRVNREVAAIKSLVRAIMSRRPDLTEAKAKEVYSLLIDEVAKRIGSGDQLAFLKMNEDLEVEITPIEIDKLKKK